MNGAHFHLIINHLPIVFPLVGLIVLAVGLLSKSVAVERTAYLIFAIGAFFSVFAMISGERAEEVVEKIQGISKQYIHRHEEAAEFFAILSYLLGGLSAVGLWASFKQKSFAKFLPWVIGGFALVVMFFAKQAGTTGGEIRHTEIRPAGDAANVEKTRSHDED